MCLVFKFSVAVGEVISWGIQVYSGGACSYSPAVVS